MQFIFILKFALNAEKIVLSLKHDRSDNKQALPGEKNTQLPASLGKRLRFFEQRFFLAFQRCKRCLRLTSSQKTRHNTPIVARTV